MSLMAQAGTDQDLKDMLNDEIVLVDDAIAAPNRPFQVNFVEDTEEEKVNAPNKKGFTSKITKNPAGLAAGKSTASNVHGFSIGN